MTDSRAEIHDYLTRYAASLAAFDARRAAGLWGTPGMILDDRFAGMLESREAMVRGLEQSYPLYQQLGLDSVGFELLDHQQLSATVVLHRGDGAAVLARMQELLGKRREKQPLEWPSAGSTFKRPQGAFAGKLIEDCGLRGFTVGGAQISEKHCGFVINRGGATCADVVALTEQVRQIVEARTGFVLEREIRVVK